MAYSGAYHPRNTEPEPAPPENEQRHTQPPRRPPFDLGAIFKKTEAAGLETDDLLMALILFLMYRESGDVDLLILLGAILLT